MFLYIFSLFSCMSTPRAIYFSPSFFFNLFMRHEGVWIMGFTLNIFITFLTPYFDVLGWHSKKHFLLYWGYNKKFCNIIKMKKQHGEPVKWIQSECFLLRDGKKKKNLIRKYKTSKWENIWTLVTNRKNPIK